VRNTATIPIIPWSRYILEQTPLKLIVYDPRTNSPRNRNRAFDTQSHQGFIPRRLQRVRTASVFWQDRINALNANAARRAQ